MIKGFMICLVHIFFEQDVQSNFGRVTNLSSNSLQLEQKKYPGHCVSQSFSKSMHSGFLISQMIQGMGFCPAAGSCLVVVLLVALFKVPPDDDIVLCLCVLHMFSLPVLLVLVWITYGRIPKYELQIL